MLSKSFFASALLLASTASAQYATSAASMPMASSAAGGQVMVQVVQVSSSNGSLNYYPNNIKAPAGSMNHTVTQSAFDTPCVPLAQTNASAASTAIKSGFMPVTASDSMIPVFTVQINDTKPIWLFCGQTGHCQKGMVAVINEAPATGKTLEAFKAKAAQFSSGSAGASGSGGVGASSTSSGGPATQTTNAAARPAVLGFSSLVGLLVLGLWMV